MTSTWKYTDATNRIVARTLDNGAYESCLVSVISDWVAAGNTPLPADTPTIGQLWDVYQQKALVSLKKSDITMARCTENNTTVPAEWATYRKALRAIVATTLGDPTQPFPPQPATYPPGT